MQAIDVCDLQLGQLLFSYLVKAANVNAIHLAHRRVIADAKCSHATMPAEVMVILV